MTNQEKSLLLEQLADKEEFIAAIGNANSKQELQNILKANGLEMNQDEIDAFISMLESGNAELGENELENVAGGVVDPLTVLGWAWSGAKAVAKKAWKWGKKLADWEDGKR